ncbi:MAG: hypothetical protein U0Z53_02150 [Blastocatellia bacterium]
MTFIDDFKRQQAEVLDLIREVSDLVQPDRVISDARIIRHALSVLAERFRALMKTEDETLSALLLAYHQPQLRAQAQRGIEESDRLRNALADFNERWMTPAFIQNNPDEFVTDTRELIEALKGRLKKDSPQLSLLVERV